MTDQIGVVDLFAGPGGLGEGFARFRDEHERKPFRVLLSVEKEKYAHKTLLLRSFFHQFDEDDEVPDEYYEVLRGLRDPASLAEGPWRRKWEQAERKALRAELGNEADKERIDDALRSLVPRDQPTILIGGPPCQAYSLAGRSRLGGDPDYDPEEDERHVLYREYLKVLSEIRPVAFVMENVKGILSSRLRGERIFNRILEDLRNPAGALNQGRRDGPRYRLFPVVTTAEEPEAHEDRDPSSFVIRTERLGAPQRRHRVILFGIQEEFATAPEGLVEEDGAPSVNSVIGSMPPIRSELSRRSEEASWHAAFNGGLRNSLFSEVAQVAGDEVAGEMKKAARALARTSRSAGAEFVEGDPDLDGGTDLERWLRDEKVGGFCNYRSRGHMTEDLHRYLFAACYARVHAESPNLKDFPESLLPDHRNVQTAVRWNSYFADRFRVQLRDQPATTITSHISKDGHYYIHFDPEQCRSLTVREAARIQTFPDNYFFCGPRTAQYVQVGNAVPPWVARQIAGAVHRTLAERGVV